MSNDHPAPDVLVVDDNSEAAEDYARLISARSGLEVIHTDNVDEALELCRTNALKVLVLDQSMPMRSGTDLYIEIKVFDTNVRAIMLTGEASRAEIGAALGLGFKAYVAKNNIQDLPEQVVREYAAYQLAAASIALSNAQTPIFVRRTARFSRDTVTYRLLRAHLLSTSHVLERDWQNIVTVHAGQTESTKITASETRSVRLEDETTSRLTSEFGLSAKHIASLGLKLGSELNTRFSSITSTESSVTAETSRTFTLPPEPSNPKSLHVRLRRIQEAPVYARIRVELTTACTCCGSNNILIFEALVPTGRTSVRHKDVLSDGTEKLYQIN
jgi:DNA-binding NarL/FixJ family response regulator